LLPLPVEIVRVQPETLDAFYRTREREALSSLFGFPVVRYVQRLGFAAIDNEDTVAAGTLRIEDSLGFVESIVVDAARRREGIGRAIEEQMSDVARYYNCHKMTVTVPHQRGAQRFFEACGYALEAVLSQHAFRVDSAVLRKFLL
jgi:GNAT superfamily N-acetyltransferase